MDSINLSIVGHSHQGALMRLVKQEGGRLSFRFQGRTLCTAQIRFLSLTAKPYGPHVRQVAGQPVFNADLAQALAHLLADEDPPPTEGLTVFGERDPAAPGLVFSFAGGNAHNLIGLFESAPAWDVGLAAHPGLPLIAGAQILTESAARDIMARRTEPHLAVLRHLRQHSPHPIVQFGGPPVLQDSAHIAATLPASLRGDGAVPPVVSPPAFRFKLWALNQAIYAQACRELGVAFLSHPAGAEDEAGYLRPALGSPTDSIHTNAAYAALLLQALDTVALPATTPTVPPHPYAGLPDQAYWRRAVATPAARDMDPVSGLPFRIGRQDRIATAGSCFAQHMARHLARSGFDYLVTERAHPLLSPEQAEAGQYGVYSARYGNVYTARQLVQLFDRAFGRFQPIESVWRRGDRWVDAFRPTIPEEGYASQAEVLAARDHHLACVRRAFTESTVFVFTLGLTETFMDTRDGAVYPVCPGTQGGQFDPAWFRFVNFGVDEVRADVEAFIARLRSVNPGVKLVLTVSPVPLMATASGQHVLCATTYSKSVLRVAAQQIAQTVSDVAYFPSYEIIVGPHARGAYFADDLRSVKPEGVNHVMRLFLQHATEQDAAAAATPTPAPAAAEAVAPAAQDTGSAEADWMKVVCEEELLDAAAACA